MIGRQPILDFQLVESQVAMQSPGSATFMPFRVAQQYQRLLRRVVQAGMQLGLPEGCVGHMRYSEIRRKALEESRNR